METEIIIGINHSFAFVYLNIANAIQFIFCSDTELGPLLLEVHLNCLIAQFSYAARLSFFVSIMLHNV